MKCLILFNSCLKNVLQGWVEKEERGLRQAIRLRNNVLGTLIRWLLNNHNKKLLEFNYCKSLELVKKEISKRKMLFYSECEKIQQASKVSIS